MLIHSKRRTTNKGFTSNQRHKLDPYNFYFEDYYINILREKKYIYFVVIALENENLNHYKAQLKILFLYN